jgi:hypothetical protein
VDDFLISGNEENPQGREIVDHLLQAFRWTPWEHTKFKQTGINVEQLPDGNIVQEQEEYLQSLEEN